MRYRDATAFRQALELRLAERARATKDSDLDWQAAEEELVDALLDAAAHETGDFFEFTVERSGTPEDRLGGAEAVSRRGSACP